MNYGKIVAILLLVLQGLNVGAYFVDMILPEYSVLVAASIGAIQAFVRQIQSSGKA
jgi:hypothetical protein